MYNSKRFETVKNMRENKKISNAVQASIGVLAVVLAALIVWMMVLVSGIQGTARVVNYAGLVRGETQRLVKMEIAGQAEDGMMESVESFINGLRFGDDELTLVRLDDKSFQTKMEELASCFESLKQEIYLVREKGFEKTDIIDKSEKFFDICDEATGLAETYSQKRASSLAVLERYITADIVVLMMLIGYEFIKALHYAAMNHALQKKVYMDEATGLPNKNKCEELLSAPEMITMPVGVCSFDLNNLRRINNSMGHEKGDAYIRIFAELVREAVPAHYFVGRAGGDEFIAIMDGADKEEMQRCLQLIRDRVDTYNTANPDFPVSYAVGISVSDENENCTMRDLYIFADKNMYINKNHVKREEALAEKKLDRRLLKAEKIRQQLFRLPVLRRKAGRLPGDSCKRGVFPCGGRQLFRRGGADCRRTRGAGRPQGGAQQITADGAVRGAFRKEPRGGIAAQDFRREQCRLWATDGDFCGCRPGRHAAPFLAGV